MSLQKPTLLTIVGITGDLSKRKLLPALEKIISAGATPKEFKVIGVTRQQLQITDLFDASKYPNVAKCMDLFVMDLTDSSEYVRLKAHLDGIAVTFSTDAQYMYYLSLPPQFTGSVIELIGANCLDGSDTKLLLEKPFGTDLASAQDLINQTCTYFEEDQLYRIDHYMAKEMAQNLVVFRDSNSLLKRTWNKDYISHIEIIASEHIGIEGRAAFYEQTGALKDLVQSHLLELAALTLMQAPDYGDEDAIPDNRLKALQQLRLPIDKPIQQFAKRGQYKEYRSEVSNPHSIVETYADITLESTDPRWVGVPIRIITGKALAKKQTSIRITYTQEKNHEANMLAINLQPQEGFELNLFTKMPGYDWKVEPSALKHSFADKYAELPDAYEKVLVDAMRSSHTLFTSSNEVLETWRILEPIRSAWEMSGEDLQFYTKGTDYTELG
jgi:glucose-6-phosphate 1-dehydrogenase